MPEFPQRRLVRAGAGLAAVLAAAALTVLPATAGACGGAKEPQISACAAAKKGTTLAAKRLPKVRRMRDCPCQVVVRRFRSRRTYYCPCLKVPR